MGKEQADRQRRIDQLHTLIQKILGGDDMAQRIVSTEGPCKDFQPGIGNTVNTDPDGLYADVSIPCLRCRGRVGVNLGVGDYRMVTLPHECPNKP